MTAQEKSIKQLVMMLACVNSFRKDVPMHGHPDNVFIVTENRLTTSTAEFFIRVHVGEHFSDVRFTYLSVWEELDRQGDEITPHCIMKVLTSGIEAAANKLIEK